MAENTKIEWTDATWNPIRGCSEVNGDCSNCYAKTVAARFSGPGLPYEGLARHSEKRGLPQWTGKVQFIRDALDQPLRWRRPRRIFTNSMSDLFHDGLTNEEIAAVFGVMAAAGRHTFQVLTKRPARALEWFRWVDSQPFAVDACINAAVSLGACEMLRSWLYKLPSTKESPVLPWPLPNVHLYVSAGTQESADRFIPLLLMIPAAIRGVSAEPLLGPLRLRGHIMSSPRPGDCTCGRGHGFTRCPNTGGVAKLNDRNGCRSFKRRPGEGIHHVIVGAESGRGARPMDEAWVRDLRDQCDETGTAFFYKQRLDQRGRKVSLPLLDDRQHAELPHA